MRQLCTFLILLLELWKVDNCFHSPDSMVQVYVWQHVATDKETICITFLLSMKPLNVKSALFCQLWGLNFYPDSSYSDHFLWFSSVQASTEVVIYYNWPRPLLFISFTVDHSWLSRYSATNTASLNKLAKKRLFLRFFPNWDILAYAAVQHTWALKSNTITSIGKR